MCIPKTMCQYDEEKNKRKCHGKDNLKHEIKIVNFEPWTCFRIARSRCNKVFDAESPAWRKVFVAAVALTALYGSFKSKVQQICRFQ